MTFAPDVYRDRLQAAQQAARGQGIDALLVTPGSDLAYLTGYHATALERLTCLVLPADGDPVLVLPRLELLAAQASPAGALGVSLRPWDESDDAVAIAAGLSAGAATVGVDDRMWAEKLLRFADALPAAHLVTAGRVLHPLRMRKDAAEVDALLAAGAAIDSVHAHVPVLLRPGRTEREVGREIAELIIGAGHASVDFVIVGSGPNGASPHHDVSDRVLAEGDAVVVDIGGTMPSGYCSDSTRTYAIGEPPQAFREHYAALVAAQAASRAAVRPGVTCEQVDAAGRQVLVDAGIGELFIHRTGHGIGLETHEEPYIVAGNTLPLEPGMAFSIEPGFYVAGRFGARIEDIVICTPDGALVANHQPRELVPAGRA